MSIVTLVSGGLDSTLMALLIKEENIKQFPLFIDYGQLNYDRELSACKTTFSILDIPMPEKLTISDYSRLVPAGITSQAYDINSEAFLPCRNLLFLSLAAGYAYRCEATSVAIGLLNESYSIFPDQTQNFLKTAESLIQQVLNKKISILSPLGSFSKAEVVALANDKGIKGTYSCHAGTIPPCGKCIACREYIGTEV